MLRGILFFVWAVCCAGCAQTYAPAKPMPAQTLASDAAITKIALGSCFTPYQSDAIFGEILRQQPDVFLFMGDNVYAEDESYDLRLMSLRQAYSALAEAPNFAALRQASALIPAWDDHDYGQDDTGGSFYAKEYSQALFEHVWAIPADDERRQRPGTYFSRIVGPQGQRVQFIVLDTRFFSTPYTKNPNPDIGRYTASADPDQNLLGDAQWQWLAQQLNEPAEVRILLSSIQVIAAGHYWESWAMMPAQQQQLYELLAPVENVVIVSGDRHSAAMYRRDDVGEQPLFELTSSSLNLPLTGWVANPQDEPGPYRITKPYYEVNYGLIELDWATRKMALQLRDGNSDIVHTQSVRF